MHKYILIGMLPVLAIATPVEAQEASAGVSLKSDYVLDDAIVATDGPVVQGWGSLSFLDVCSAEGWFSKGITTNVGDEIDLGGGCTFYLGDGVEMELNANRYLLFAGVPDMTAVDVKLSKAGFDLTLSQYVWDSNPDATRIQVGYNFDVAEHADGRVEATYETGFGLSDTVVLGADLSRELGGCLSLSITGRVPIKKSGANGAGVVFSAACNF